MKRYFFQIISGLIFFAGIGLLNVFACSCIRWNKPTVEFRKTPVIFVGTVKVIDSVDSRELGQEFNFNERKVVFTVEKPLKGVRKEEIAIYTSSQGTACGYPFQTGSRYLVYAYGGSGDQKIYSTGICSRTRLAEQREDEIAVLESLARGKFEPRIYGRVDEIVRGIYLGDRAEDLPMSGIRITARGANARYETISDDKGEFRFTKLKPGRYVLNLKIPSTHKLGGDSWDFDEKPDLDFTITNRDCPDFIVIKTRVDGRIKGRVYDYQGKPVGKDVRVSLITAQTVDKPDDQIEYISESTNKKGYFEFVGIPPGEFYLGINLDVKPHRENPYPKTFYPNVRTSEESVLIKLERGQRLKGFDLILPKPPEMKIIRGRVLRNGQPVVDATVYVSNRARHDFEDFVWLKTDQNGEFRAKCLKGIAYRFVVYDKDSEGYATVKAGEVKRIIGETNDPVEFDLAKPEN